MSDIRKAKTSEEALVAYNVAMLNASVEYHEMAAVYHQMRVRLVHDLDVKMLALTRAAEEKKDV